MSPSDAQICERIVRAHARTFHMASLFLPAERRRGAFALYAFCRRADDMVDDARRAGERQGSRARLAAYARDLDATFHGRPPDAVFREVAWTTGRFGIPRDPLDELLGGVARDLDETRYETWGMLQGYCAGVASSVGEMCTHVFGVSGSPDLAAKAIHHARMLGTAMQLTNILRDVGEDGRRGRCYLPEDDLAAHGLTPAEVLDGSALRRRDQWRAMMSAQVARARGLYQDAVPGIALLAPDAQRCASACAIGYAGILTVLEAQDFDCFTRRASLGWPARARLIASCWLGSRPRGTTAGVAGSRLTPPSPTGLWR